MPNAFIVVEGQTEETFVNLVLYPFFLAGDPCLNITPIVLQTKRDASGKKFRGGATTYERFKSDVRNVLSSTPKCVSTMVDLFRLPSDFPGFDRSRNLATVDRVKALESAIAEDISDTRFIPYISIHEFEALLLCAPEAICEIAAAQGLQRDTFMNEVRGAGPPEAINGSDPPSYRILKHFPEYEKVRDGVVAAEQIGIRRMRESCGHFDEWLSKLESALRLGA